MQSAAAGMLKARALGEGEPSAAPCLKVTAIKRCWSLSDPGLGALEGAVLDPGAGSEHPHGRLCLGAQQRPQEMVIPGQQTPLDVCPLLLPLALLGWVPGESLSLGAVLGLGSPSAACRVPLKVAPWGHWESFSRDLSTRSAQNSFNPCPLMGVWL